MQDALLLVSVIVTLAVGGLFMKKLDQFLEEDCQAQGLQPEAGEHTLRIGFFNPSMADSITDALEQFSKIDRDLSVRLFCGSEEELLAGLSDHRLDVVFLPEDTDLCADTKYHVKKVVWAEEAKTPFACRFIKFML